jgi:DNA-binding transcriptional regulator LsrR (DeoR family)
MEHNAVLASIAQDYYLTDLGIGELADKYHLSRYLVKKYLDDAKESKIVKITIASPVERRTELERQFHKTFDIKNIYVIKDPESDDSGGEFGNFLDFAANEVFQHIRASHIVGTVWGDTIYELTEHFPNEPLEDVVFTQFLGENRRYNSQAGSTRMVEHVAEKFSANYITLSGPLYIVDPSVRAGMEREIASQPAFEAAHHMDLIFTGLGTLASIESIHTWKDNIQTLFPSINPGDIAGMLYGHPYDIDGNFFTFPDDCVFGLGLEQILAVPERIGIVRSKFKSSAVIGALRGKLLTELIITESAARRVLA